MKDTRAGPVHVASAPKARQEAERRRRPLTDGVGPKHGASSSRRGQAQLDRHARRPAGRAAGRGSPPRSSSARATPRAARTSASSSSRSTARSRPLGVSRAPVLSPGALGAFDDAGSPASCLVAARRPAATCYYTGWSLGVTVPFYLAAGLAVSDDGGRASSASRRRPSSTAATSIPTSTASPWVIVEDGRWRMWYVSGSGWDGRRRARAIATTSGTPSRPTASTGAGTDVSASTTRRRTSMPSPGPAWCGTAIATACGTRSAARAIAWATRSRRTGCAWSASDTTNVRRRRRPPGWDSEMLCYPCVFGRRRSRLRLLYNGNGYGRTGIGYATSD